MKTLTKSASLLTAALVSMSLLAGGILYASNDINNMNIRSLLQNEHAISSLMESQKSSTIDIVKLKAEVSTNKADKESLLSQLNSSKTEIEGLKARIAELEALNGTQTAEKEQLQQKLAEAQSLASTEASPAVFVLNVWTSGYQNEIDECKGAVDISAVYKTPAVAEHSHCGGDDFPKQEGSIIQVTGIYAGTYRVDGLIKRLNVKVDDSGDIPIGQADLLYQTCLNGATDMGLFKLTKIG